MTNYRYLISILFAAPSISISAEKASSSPIDTSTMALQVVLALGIVTASIFALAWVAKRLGNTHLLHNQKMKLVSSMALGSREKMVLVEVEGQKLLLGVTPNNIASLHVFPADCSVNNHTEGDKPVEISEHGIADIPTAAVIPEKWDFSRYFKKMISDSGDKSTTEARDGVDNEGGKA